MPEQQRGAMSGMATGRAGGKAARPDGDGHGAGDCDPAGYWTELEGLVGRSEIVIDRPRGTSHPKYPSFVYPVDYGYLRDTASMDGNGIDVFRGAGKTGGVVGIVCVVDLLKRDSEIKILYRCSPGEIGAILRALDSPYMRALYVPRDPRAAPVTPRAAGDA